MRILENEIAKAFIAAYAEQAQSLFESYLDNAECFTNRTTVKDRITREEREPDEMFRLQGEIRALRSLARLREKING